MKTNHTGMAAEVHNVLYDMKWEKVMFGYVIKSEEYTIRVYKKKRRITRK